MKDEIKKFCEYEYVNTSKRGFNPHEATTRCYGAIPKFRELERR